MLSLLSCTSDWSLITIYFTGITIIVSKRGYQIDVALMMPNEFHNVTLSGLFGNFNYNPFDDLISASGRALNANASEELIYRSFGETCELIFPCLKMTLCYCWKQKVWVETSCEWRTVFKPRRCDCIVFTDNAINVHKTYSFHWETIEVWGIVWKITNAFFWLTKSYLLQNKQRVNKVFHG